VPRLPLDSGTLSDLSTALACGGAAILGHCFPAWHGFRGGKGAATSIGVLLVVQAWLVLPMLATWVLVLVLSGYVSLATVLAALALIPAAWWLDSPTPVMVFVTVLAAFIAFTHRDNFRRLRRGRESRFERARVFRRR
jgi:glycerol-3-phosphate acyltransferase PlsY